MRTFTKYFNENEIRQLTQAYLNGSLIFLLSEYHEMQELFYNKHEKVWFTAPNRIKVITENHYNSESAVKIDLTKILFSSVMVLEEDYTWTSL